VVFFRDKTAVVTGAGSGLGRAIARALAREGADVHIVDVNRERIREVENELRAAGAPIEAHVTNVADPDAMMRLADRVFESRGRVDLLFNNAGVCAGGPVESLRLEDWRWSIDVNLYGVIHGLMAFVPRMIGQGGKSVIVNTASMAGLVGFPYMAPYSASKFAVVGLGESLASELAPHGIHVLTVCPGAVATNVIRDGRIALPGDYLGRVERFFNRQAADPDRTASRILKAVRRRKTLLVMSGSFWPLYVIKRISSSLYVAVFRILTGRVAKNTR